MGQQLDQIREAGLFKTERMIRSPQDMHIRVGNASVLNLCANNYLGLSEHPAIREAAAEGLEHWGYGLSSVRFICGTQAIHKELEFRLSEFLGTDDTILYTSCFDANGGLFETLLTDADAVISDELNHASIIDGIRLCKAQRFRYRNNDMADLEEKLKAASSARFRLIATDGVFSMDGTIANLPGICELADRFASQGYGLSLVELAQLVEQPLQQLERRSGPWRWRDWQVLPLEGGRWRLQRDEGGLGARE